MSGIAILKDFLLLAFVVVVYFLPSIISRMNHRRSPVYLINLLFGWTVIGWLIALGIALEQSNEKQCPACAKFVDRQVRGCRYCGYVFIQGTNGQ